MTGRPGAEESPADSRPPGYREEILAAEPTEAFAGLLDRPVPADGQVPALWHWLYLLDRWPTRALGPDGHALHGIPAPPGPGMRRMFAGGRVISSGTLRVGETASRTSAVISSVEKAGRTGPLRFVTVRHEYRQNGRVVIQDEQDIVYRQPSGDETARPAGPPEPGPVSESPVAVMDLNVDEPLLFRFSALTYNAHRIHYDRSWCAREGYPDLVVHGPLQALMMGELAHRQGISLVGTRFSYRLMAPMIGPQRMRVALRALGPQPVLEVRSKEVTTATATVDRVAGDE